MSPQEYVSVFTVCVYIMHPLQCMRVFKCMCVVHNYITLVLCNKAG